MKRVISTLVFFCLCVFSFAQKEFPKADEIIKQYAPVSVPDPLPKGTELKLIEFPTQMYSVEGYFTKNALAEGSQASFYDTNTPSRLILQGVVSYQAGRLIITGQRTEYSNISKSYIYGVFEVSNTQDKHFIFKPKKAGVLAIENAKIDYYCCKYSGCPTTVSLGENASIDIDGASLDYHKPYMIIPLHPEDITLDNFKDIGALLMKANTDVTLKYKNKSQFDGNVTPIDEGNGLVSLEMAYGKYTYPNGETFVGNMTKNPEGRFGTDGITYFNDGTVKEGNWLAAYNLTAEEMKRVQQEVNPSQARDQAEKLIFGRKHVEYQLKPEADQDFGYTYYVRYFHVGGYNEGPINQICRYIVYNADEKLYYCYVDNKNKELFCAISIDENGNHLKEIEYERIGNTNEFRSVSYNLFERYPDGSLSAIKTYACGSNKPVLVCHFFSDGALRSAYRYGDGNGGKTVLRKSKEAHPTLGGYTSKQYDFDGNYERLIEWPIGEETSIFGGSNKKDMSPGLLLMKYYTRIY